MASQSLTFSGLVRFGRAYLCRTQEKRESERAMACTGPTSGGLKLSSDTGVAYPVSKQTYGFCYG
jgi:hypothetical protein